MLALEKAGADGSLKNEAGHAASTGIDGKKVCGLVAEHSRAVHWVKKILIFLVSFEECSDEIAYPR